MNKDNEQREIKFRAWLRDVGIMLSVYVLDQTGNAGRGTHFKRSKGYSEHYAQFVFNIDDADLMQFTGYKDKSGQEIFEGDLMTLKNADGAVKFEYEVRFEDAKFVLYHTIKAYGKWGDLYRVFDPDFREYDFLVTGNIFESSTIMVKQ